MNLKTIFLSTAILICTLQIFAQLVDPVMPIDATQTSTMSINPEPIDSNSIPNLMPPANQVPVMPPISNTIQDIQQPTPPVTTLQPQVKSELLQTSQTLPPALTKEQTNAQQKTNQSINKPQDTKDKQAKAKNLKPKEGTLTNSELDFEVENQTGKTIYVVCFSYINKRPFSRWRWDKSSIYKIEDNNTVVIDLDTIPDEENRNQTFGYLGIFDNQKDAEDSTIELLDDNKKIDLDIIAQLHGKKITIEIEKYGIVGEFYDFDFKNIDKKKETKKQPELDFYVENKTGKTIYVTCFVYEKKAKGTWLAKKTTEAWTIDEDTRDDMSVWRFDKTSVIKLKPNEIGLIDVDTIIEPRDRIYIRGYLAIFDEDEQELAEKAIYELMPANRRLDLGKLIELKRKKISVYTEKYGTTGNFIDYVVKPTQKPNIKKVVNGYLK